MYSSATLTAPSPDGRLTRRSAPASRRRRGSALAVTAWTLAAALPLVGLVSLLLREQLDVDWDNYRVHFALFLTVGLGVFVLAYAAGAAANRRGDARVLLISLAFLATGGFLGLHALGTTGVLFTQEYAGFKVANPVGLVVAARLRPRVGVRRRSPFVRPVRRAPPRRAAPRGADRAGSMVRLDGRRAAAPGRARQRGRLAQLRRRDGGRRRGGLRRRGRAFLVRLPRAGSACSRRA